LEQELQTLNETGDRGNVVDGWTTADAETSEALAMEPTLTGLKDGEKTRRTSLSSFSPEGLLLVVIAIFFL